MTRLFGVFLGTWSSCFKVEEDLSSYFNTADVPFSATFLNLDSWQLCFLLWCCCSLRSSVATCKRCIWFHIVSEDIQIVFLHVNDQKNKMQIGNKSQLSSRALGQLKSQTWFPISECVFLRLYTCLIVISICVPLCSDRAGSISTLDSLDFARYSDDGNRESDERVAGKTNHTVRAKSKRPGLPQGN